jgi:hypothetical protein
MAAAYGRLFYALTILLQFIFFSSNSIEEFTQIVNERYDESNLKEGYAPFCKHLFIANDFTDAVVNVLPITPENEACLRSKYEARNEKEVRRAVM